MHKGFISCLYSIALRTVSFLILVGQSQLKALVSWSNISSRSL